MKRQHKADFALLIVAIGWGASFILTKNALNDLATFNFLALRFIAAFFLSAGIFYKNFKYLDKKTFINSFIVGSVLFSGYAIQTIGLHYTTVSKSAFITGFSVVLVPLFTSFIYKKIPEPMALVGSITAFIGIALLSLNGKLGINIGDVLTLISAVAFASHIIAVGYFTSKSNSILLGILQIGVVGFWSLIATFLFESPIVPSGVSIWTNLIVLSTLCTSGAFITQSIAQQYTTATHTALIYSGEPVFASVFAYFIVGEVLSGRGLLGACMILLGMLAAELDIKKIISNINPKYKSKAKKNIA